MEIIEKADPLYPQSLREITNSPIRLFIEGNQELLKKEEILAIIGSRHCSDLGRKQAEEFAKELAWQGITIISGMAIGIDKASHEGALKVGGTTIAVLGCGFHQIYPKENIGLYHKILEHDGLIISEYPPQTKAKSEYFIQRNRIISGMSKGVFVIEAMYRSGTSVTAAIAKKQAKKVFCLPHDLDNRYGVGTNALLKKGASLVTNPKDLMTLFPKLSYRETNTQKHQILNSEYEFLYHYLQEEHTIDEISRKVKRSISELHTLLFEMEVEGLIEELIGGSYRSKK